MGKACRDNPKRVGLKRRSDALVGSAMRGKLRPDVSSAVVSSVFSHNIVTESDAKLIALGVGKPCMMPFPDLADALSEIARSYAFAANRSGRLSDAATSSSAARVARVAADLLNSLGVGAALDTPLYEHLGGGGLYGFAMLDLGQGGAEAVTHAIAAVSDLRRWSLALSEHSRRRAKAAKPIGAHRPDISFNKMIASLDHVYFAAFDEFPRAGADRAAGVDGPFVRFLSAFVNHLAGRKILRNRQPAALAKVWQRLPAQDKSNVFGF